MAPRMVFIYGPPPVGKLPVARLVAERTGFKLRGKIVDVETLDAVLSEFECLEPIAGRDTITLDTETMSPEEAADRIAALGDD